MASPQDQESWTKEVELELWGGETESLAVKLQVPGEEGKMQGPENLCFLTPF